MISEALKIAHEMGIHREPKMLAAETVLILLPMLLNPQPTSNGLRDETEPNPSKMKLRSGPVLAILGTVTPLLLSLTALPAATLYYDGGTIDIAGNGDSAASGLTGDWNTTLLNWDAGAVPYVGWNNLSNDIAFFHRGTAIPGPNPGTVSLTGDITVGGLVFNASTYTINTGANTLTFGATDNTVSLNNSATAAGITGAIDTNAANVIVTAQNPLTEHTLTFLGASAGGWSGSTIINAGATLLTRSTSGINQVLDDTSGINLNGGTVYLYRATNANINAISDSAAITVNSGGSLRITSNDAGGGSAIENIGAVTVTSGQMDFNFTNNASSGQQVVMAGLTRSGSTSALTFSGNSLTSSNKFIVTGAGTTAAGEVMGAWATTGPQNGVSSQRDYAVFNGDEVHPANIAGTPQSAWSTDFTTGTGTLNNTLDNASGSVSDGVLTASRNINTLRNASTPAAAAANSTTEYFTLAGHSFVNGDLVTVSGTGGTSAGTPYYIIESSNSGGSGGADTFQISTTPGGSAVNLTNTTAGQVSGGLNLNGSSLGTYGILNGTTSANSGFAIAGSGSITLPTTSSGNLHVSTSASAMTIDSAITNNGAGVLTLVRNGANTLTLRGNNTYTGGTVVNSGTIVLSGTNTFATGSAGADVINGGALTYSTLASWGGSGRDVTFNGTGTLTSSAGGYTGGTLTSNAGANAVIASGGGSLAFATTTGTGNVIFSTGANRLLNLGDASGLTGNIQARLTGNANYGTSVGIQFSSIGDAAGSAIQFAGGTSDSNQALTVAYNGSAALVFNNRQIQMLDRVASNWEIRDNIIANNSSNAAHTWTINTDLLYTGGRAVTAFGGALQTNRRFVLSGSNTGDNAFNGVISNGQNTNGLVLDKSGSGKWILGGTNTFTGNTIVNAGNLEVGGTLGHVSAGVGNYSGNISISNSSSGRFVYNSSATQTLGGVVSGNGALFVEDGTLILTNSNTYTGATNVNGGLLLVNGSLASGSAVNVNGGTLGGTGTVGGNVTAAAGASIAPGASAGTLNVGGNLDISALAGGAGTLDFELDVDTASSDQIAVTGTLTIGSGLLGITDFAFTDLGGLADGTYVLITSGGINGGDSLDGADLSGPVGSGTGTLGINGNNIELTVTGIGGGPGPVDHFVISAISSPQVVGTAITGITITAEDSSNNVATGFTGTVDFSGTGGFSGTSGSFTAGVLTGVSVTPTVAGDNLTLVVTETGDTPTGSTVITKIRTLYEDWSGELGFDVDTNGDGIDNGMAWLLGAADPNADATSLLPGVSESGGDLVLTFNCLPVAARGGASLKVAYSATLAGWTPTTNVVPDASGADAGGVVSYVVSGPSGSPSVNSVTATIDSSAAAGGKLFGRLEGTE